MAEAKAKPTADLAALMRLAGAHHQRGEWALAEALYREIVDADPGHFDALHLCGVLMHQRGRPVEALALIGRALKAHDRVAPAHSNLGIVLAVLERHEEAVASYDRALALKPDYAEALHNRGNALAALGRADEALASYEQAIALRPDYAAALVNRAQVLQRAGRIEDALAGIERALTIKPSAGALALRARLLRRLSRNEEALASFAFALSLAPDDADTLTARGNTHYAMSSFALALADYDRATALTPDAAYIHNNRGNALRGLGRHDEALAAFGRALALRPDYAEPHNNRGNACLELNRPAEALADYDAALALKPDDTDTLTNRGNALRYLGRAAEAIASFDAAIARSPDLAEAHWNKALTCLSLGQFAAGWRDYEWRFKRAHWVGARNFTQAQWRGEDVSGKRILLHAEQGFGDAIQFLRYAPLVAARGATVILELPENLMPLAQGMTGIETILPRGAPLPAFDLHCPLMSLPLVFDTTLETIPSRVPYLSAPPAQLDKWRTHFPQSATPRVGLVWSGKPTHPNDRNRSIALAALHPILSMPGITFVSLQPETRAADRAEFAKHPQLVRLDGLLTDFADTAAVIETLDLTIAVDSAVAHLAGALGKPAFILLPAIGDWRWLIGRGDCPWYPSARLFRQPRIGDWPSAIAEAAQALAAFCKTRSATP